MPIGRSLTGQRLSAAAATAPAPFPFPRCVIGLPQHDSAAPRRIARPAPATFGTQNSEAPVARGSVSEPVDRTRNHSRERSIPREVGGCTSQAPPSKAEPAR